jgi:NOL1/NOP2/fmu family ribosome biogenesis protein
VELQRTQSIRINPNKISHKIPYPRVLWTEHGYYIPADVSCNYDPLFHVGGYCVQDDTDMFIEHIIRPFCFKPLKVLDLCAGKGGKSTQIISIIERGSLLISNNPNSAEIQVLSHNLITWGKSNCIVTQNCVHDFAFLPGFFDVIIVDETCLSRKDVHSDSILQQVWKNLTPGGLLVFCSSSQVHSQLYPFIQTHQAESVPVPLKADWNISEDTSQQVFSYTVHSSNHGVPDKTVATIRKLHGTIFEPPQRAPSSPIQIVPKKNKLRFSHLITNYASIVYERTPNVLWSFSKDYRKLLMNVYAHCTVIHAGIPLVEIHGNKLNPLPGLAWANSFNDEVLPSLDIDCNTAFHYLQKKELSLPDAPKGWVILRYNNIPIGFIKNNGKKISNPFPHEWSLDSEICEKNIWSICE